MILTEILVGGSALFAGVQAYKKRRKTVRIARFLQAEKKPGKPRKATASHVHDGSKIAGKQVNPDRIMLLWGKASSPSSNNYEPMFRQDLTIASISMGLAIAGSALFSPLSLLSVPGTIYICRHYFVNSYRSLKKGKVNLDTLVALKQTLFFVTGYYILVNMTNLLFLLNTSLLAKIKDNSRKDFIDVFRHQPRLVWVLSNGVEVEMPFETLKRDDIVVVNAGETVPVDGYITEGMASIDQHVLTGESRPVEKGSGDQVFALTVVSSGRIYVKVEKAGEETTAARIGQILNQTVDFKTDRQLWAETMVDKTAVPTL